VAQSADVLRQAAFFDHDIWPDRIQQRAFLDELPRMLNQIQQSVEDAWRERHDFAGGSPEQQSLCTIEPELAEVECLGRRASNHDALPGNDSLILLSDGMVPTFQVTGLLALARVECN
jgi:hypothetical protein